MTRLPHRAAPRLACWRSCLGSMRQTMRPTSPERAVDLVEHAPGIGDVEEAVLGERRRLVEFVAGAAAERHRIGELEVLDVVLVDARERREALAVIGAMVHQPVLRLLVGIDEPLAASRRPRAPAARWRGAARPVRGSLRICVVIVLSIVCLLMSLVAEISLSVRSAPIGGLQPEHVEHGGVALLLELRRVDEPGLAGAGSAPTRSRRIACR